MQICVLNVLIILYSLLLCSVVVLLPAGDAVGDSEGCKLINPCWVSMAWCPVFILAQMESLEANNTQEVLSLSFSVKCCYALWWFFFSLGKSLSKLLFYCNIFIVRKFSFSCYYSGYSFPSIFCLVFPSQYTLFHFVFLIWERPTNIRSFSRKDEWIFVHLHFQCIVFLPIDILLIFREGKESKPYINKLPLAAVLGTFH